MAFPEEINATVRPIHAPEQPARVRPSLTFRSKAASISWKRCRSSNRAMLDGPVRSPTGISTLADVLDVPALTLDQSPDRKGWPYRRHVVPPPAGAPHSALARFIVAGYRDCKAGRALRPDAPCVVCRYPAWVAPSRSSRIPVEASRRGSVASISVHSSPMSLRGSTHSTPNQFHRSPRRIAAE